MHPDITPQARSSRGHWRDILLLIFVAVMGFGATWYAYTTSEQSRLLQQRERLTTVGRAALDSFDLDLLRMVEAVRATGLLISSHRYLALNEFTYFTRTLLRNVPTIESLEWQPVVKAREVKGFELTARKFGLSHFKIHHPGRLTLPEQSEYLPVLFSTQPENGRLGLDIMAFPERMAAKRLARDSGQPSATKHFLSQGSEVFAISVAVPLPDAVSAQFPTAGEGVLGYATGIVNISNMFREATFRADAAYIDLVVFDLAAETPELIHRSSAKTPMLAYHDIPPNALRLSVDVANRPWEIVLLLRPEFTRKGDRLDGILILAVGLLSTLFLIFALHRNQRSQRQTLAAQAIQKVAEKSLLIERQHLHNILDGTNAGTWQWHVSTGEVIVNERWAGMLGYTLAELEPISLTTWTMLCQPDDLTLAIEKQRRHFAGELELYDTELRMRHKDGGWVWVLARGRLISRNAQGQPEWMAGTHLDISESKRLNQQISDIRTALDAHAIVAITDVQGVITFANDQFCAVSGFERGEIVGQTHRILNSGFHSKAFFRDLWETISQGKTWRGQIKNRAKNGSLYWVDTTIAPILDATGKPAQYIAIRYEITEQKLQAESLLVAKEMAEEANQAKSVFLATMSHEIRTPMNGILGMLKLLSHTELNARQLDYTSKAEMATKALLGIINDILDFSKIEAGKLTLEHSPFVLEEVMQGLAIVLSANLDNKPIELLFSVDRNVPQNLVGDALRLRQVLLNLSGNAIKFTERGNVLIKIQALHSDSNRTHLEFSVEDTGIGIAPEKLSHIFEGFSQAESSTTRRYGGSGLGLAISRQLVDYMGGSLQVESVLGQGSRFFFSAGFDLAPAIITHPADNLTSNGDSAPPLQLLIIDDSPIAREVLGEMALAQGWVFEVVASGAAALERVANSAAPAVDIVLVDWQMPELDGWETTRRLRQFYAGQVGQVTPAIIMVTANGQEVYSQKSPRELELLNGYLSKPITRSALASAVLEANAGRYGARPVKPVIDRSQQLAGLSLLVVEDNRLNQQIAKELLEGQGASVTIASGGLEAVALMQQPVQPREPIFDSILMDLQMPDIDGLEATRRIRSDPALQVIPIIAMTANAMASDKAACLEAGMVDHVSKPVDLDQLIATLRRHIRPERLKTASANRPAPAAETTPSVTHAGLDSETAIKRLGNNRQLYDQVVNTFRADIPGQLITLNQQVADHAVADAIRTAHTIKGLAATVGGGAMAKTAGAIESGLKQLHPTERSQPAAIELTALCAQLQAEFEALLPALARLTSLTPPTAPAQTEPADGKAYDQARLIDQLSQLKRLLAADDMQATRLGNEIGQAYEAALGAHWAPVAQAINQLDFASALSACILLEYHLAQHD